MWRAFLIPITIMTEFRSRYNLFVTSVQVDGKRVHVEFTGMRDGGSYYVGNDPKIVEALKKQMTNYYYVFREIKPEVVEVENTDTGEIETVEMPVSGNGTLTQEDIEPKDEKGEDPEQISEVTNISEAKEYLRTLGIDHRKLSTPKSILAQAQIAGVLFPNLAQ